MTTPQFKQKRSNQPGKIPTPQQLSDGQIAVNTADGSMYTEKDGGTYRLNDANTTLISAPYVAAFSVGDVLYMKGDGEVALARTYSSGVVPQDKMSQVIGVVVKKHTSPDTIEVATSGVVELSGVSFTPDRVGQSFYVSETGGPATRYFLDKNSILLSVYTVLDTSGKVKINIGQISTLGESAIPSGPGWEPPDYTTAPDTALDIDFLDSIYARTSSLGISSIGDIGDDFLPISGAVDSLVLFSPKEELPLTVGNYEPSGDICVLGPTTDGQRISYKRIMIKGWGEGGAAGSKVFNTDLEFRPPFLSSTEYIRNIYTLSDNAAIAEVYNVTTPGGVITHTFARHVYMEFLSGGISNASTVSGVDLGTKLITYAKETFKNYWTVTSTSSLPTDAVTLKMLRSCKPAAITTRRGVKIIMIPVPITLGKTGPYGGETPAIDFIIVDTSNPSLVVLRPGGHQTAGSNVNKFPCIPLINGNSQTPRIWDVTDANSTRAGRMPVRVQRIGSTWYKDISGLTSNDTAGTYIFQFDSAGLMLYPDPYGPNGGGAANKPHELPNLYSIRSFSKPNTPDTICVSLTIYSAISKSYEYGPNFAIVKHFEIDMNDKWSNGAFNSGTVYAREVLSDTTFQGFTYNGSPVGKQQLGPGITPAPKGGYRFNLDGNSPRMISSGGYSNIFSQGYSPADEIFTVLGNGALMRVSVSSEGTLDGSQWFANYSKIRLSESFDGRKRSDIWTEPYSLLNFSGTVNSPLDMSRATKEFSLKKTPPTPISEKHTPVMVNGGILYFSDIFADPHTTFDMEHAYVPISHSATPQSGGFNSSMNSVSETYDNLPERYRVKINGASIADNKLRGFPSSYVWAPGTGPSGEDNYIHNHTCNFLYSTDHNLNILMPTVGYKGISFGSPDGGVVELITSQKKMTVDSTFWDDVYDTCAAQLISILGPLLYTVTGHEISVNLILKSELDTGISGVYRATVSIALRTKRITDNSIIYMIAQYISGVDYTISPTDPDLEIVTGFHRSTPGGTPHCRRLSVGGFALSPMCNYNLTVESKNPQSSNVALITRISAMRDTTQVLSLNFTVLKDGTLDSIMTVPGYYANWIAASTPPGQSTFNNISYNTFSNSVNYRKFGIWNKNSGDDIFFPYDMSITWPSGSSHIPSTTAIGGLVPITTPLSVIGTMRAVAAWDLYVNSPIPVLLNGVYSVIYKEASDQNSVKIPLTDLIGVSIDDLKNKTIYLYIEQFGANTELVASMDQLPELLSRAYIGTLTTSTIGITSINVLPQYRILTYRISEVARGGSIPASVGLPSTMGGSTW